MSPRPTTRNWRGVRAHDASSRADPPARGPVFERVVLADDAPQATTVAPAVRESLRLAASRLLGEPLLSALELREVEPLPCGVLVRLVFQPTASGVKCCECSALQRLRELRPLFRHVLSTVGQPGEPLFEVRSWSATPREQQPAL